MIKREWCQLAKKYILFGAGHNGRRMLNIIGKENVKFFVDNDIKKQGHHLCGVSIYSPIKIQSEKNAQVIICVIEEYVKQIEQQLERMGVTLYESASAFLEKSPVEHMEIIKKLYNIYAGRRCFIIGTGPSLRIEDLEKLKRENEITFASNKIFKLFNDTKWRPDLYCISDTEVFSFYYDIIMNLDVKMQFLVNLTGLNNNYYDFHEQCKENQYVFNIYKQVIEQDGIFYPAFSKEPFKYIVDGGITVTYSMLQWAYFLGFDEVYLLGVDFDYQDTSGKDDSKVDHFCDNYIEEGEVVNAPKIADSLKAYQVAGKFLGKKKFDIYNATRGGKLEVFERVSFDELFEKKE